MCEQELFLLLVLLFLAFLFPLVGILFFRQTTLAILSDLRLPRILHYVALGALGLSLYLRQTGRVLNLGTYLLVFLLFILCLIYAAVFAIVTNNIEDLETDEISNPLRPLVQGRVELRPYLYAGIFCQIVALLAASAHSLRLFIGIFAISLGYFLYSCQPFRLKKIPFLAKALIGFNSFCISITGYVLYGGNYREFPLEWAFFILIPLSLAANFVDLKDVEGDRKMGVKTLPVMWGYEKARYFIAASTLLSYLTGAILLGHSWAYLLSISAAAVHIFLLFAHPYNEKPIFAVYVGSLLALSVILLVC